MLVGALAFLLLGVASARRGELRATAGYALASFALFTWYVVNGTVPSEFVGFAPHLTTLLVLSLGRQTLRPPAGIDYAYRRSEAT